MSKSPVYVSVKGRNSGTYASWTPVTGDDADTTEVSPSVSSFVLSPSIYSTYSGDQPHPATVLNRNGANRNV